MYGDKIQTNMRKRIEIKYSGRVQGVGFRFTAERLAKANGVNGYVKNLSDGRVAVVAEGEEKLLEGFLNALEIEMERCLDNKNLEWLPPTGEFKRFEIRF